MRKGFSQEEKDIIRDKLTEECEKSWALYGYKKTGIKDLTSKVGISTGAFYLLYDSKEDLFYATMEEVQNRLKMSIDKIINDNPSKEGFIEAMEWHFQEYKNAPFLYDTSSEDFLALLRKLPNEQVEKFKFDSIDFLKEIVQRSNLELKVDFDMFESIICTILFTVSLEEKFNCNSEDVFEFLLDSIVDRVFY